VDLAASSLSADTLYYYAFYATNATLATSTWSTVQTFSTALSATETPVFSAPTVLGYNSIQLDWTDNADNNTGYILQRATSAGGPYTVVSAAIGPAVETYTDTGLSQDTEYFYQLAATNSSNGSSTLFASCQTNATTEVQTSVLLFEEGFESPVIAGGENPWLTPTNWTFVARPKPHITGLYAGGASGSAQCLYGYESAWILRTTDANLSEVVQEGEEYTLTCVYGYVSGRSAVFGARVLAIDESDNITQLAATNIVDGEVLNFAGTLNLTFTPSSNVGERLCVEFNGNGQGNNKSIFIDNAELWGPDPTPKGTLLILR
jgi:hypothetical protein